MRKTYLLRNGKLVEKKRELGGFGVLRDIEPFTTQDGVHITSRSQLREYEQKNGVRQSGNDWTGSAKPHWWDEHKARRNTPGYSVEQWGRR